MYLCCWQARQRIVFEGDAGPNAIATAVGFVKLKMDYGLYKDKVCGLSSSPRPVVVLSWHLPPTSFVKVNIDVHGNGVSLSMIIRDDYGGIKDAG